MEHIRHCVPSNVSSGWATLPLKYVWLDGKENKSWPTDTYLPTGEPLNGSWAYTQIMSYFTTNAMTPMEVHELGKKQLDILHPMVSCRLYLGSTFNIKIENQSNLLAAKITLSYNLDVIMRDYQVPILFFTFKGNVKET